MDLNQAILYGLAVNAAYAVPPSDLDNRAGTDIQIGAVNYEVVTSIYANDLATDVNPDRGKSRVSIGLILQAAAAGDVIIAVRGTEGYMEWIHDAQFLLVPCPFMPSAGNTEDGFTEMYRLHANRHGSHIQHRNPGHDARRPSSAPSLPSPSADTVSVAPSPHCSPSMSP